MSAVSQLSRPRPCPGAASCPPARPTAAAATSAPPPPRPGPTGAACSPAGGAASRGRPQRGTACAATDFHQSRLAASERRGELPPLASVAVREAAGDAELQAASWLRALSFYRYPEERKFAAQVHRTMIAEEEFKALKAAALDRKLGTGPPSERGATLVAVCGAGELAGSQEPLDACLLLGGGGSNGGGSAERGGGSSSGGSGGSGYSSGSGGSVAGGQQALVGTLDLYAVRALAGEVLIGDSRNAAYLSNVCTAGAARRRGVGQLLLQEARRVARAWGVEALYVHTMAVNEIAVRFYARHGFVVEKKESSNAAHYRGRCLDGIEGRGRTVLMRDTRLHG